MNSRRRAAGRTTAAFGPICRWESTFLAQLCSVRLVGVARKQQRDEIDHATLDRRQLAEEASVGWLLIGVLFEASSAPTSKQWKQQLAILSIKQPLAAAACSVGRRVDEP